MRHRPLIALGCLGLLAAVAWLGSAGLRGAKPAGDWVEVAPGVYRTPAAPFGYALVADGHALLIDAPSPADGLQALGVKQVDAVLLTHHHRDTAAEAGNFLRAKVPVRAAKAGADWLTPDGVRKYWKESLPLRSSRTAYFVLPAGLEGIDCSLEDGQKIDWRGWTVKVVATKGKDGEPWVFCGDALATPGKIWSPFTTDWDHWTDAGLKPTGESLRKLAALKPKALLPAHGPVITKDPVGVLTETARAVEEVAFLKSFQRFSERLGKPPTYSFLVPKEQVASAGEKPWARVSEHLFITGNTYALVSKGENAFLVVDPWGKRSVDQIAKLKKDRNLGPLEVVLFSHAHYDHYDGVYDLPGREKYQVWALDLVSGPLADPFKLRAPFLDARPVKFDRRFKDGEAATWREYKFRFHHLPGQTAFTSGVEADIDGKRCYFTADNFFHQEQFSGSGGWMGLNRSWPLPYAASAQKVLDAAPDWVLAEHGGPFEFNAEDFRRRVRWGQASARAADAISPSGSHRRDWDPNRVTAQPILQPAKPGATVKALLRASNPGTKPETLTVKLEGRGLTPDQNWALEVPPGKTVEREITLKLPADLPKGRHVFLLRNADAEGMEGVDAFVAVVVE